VAGKMLALGVKQSVLLENIDTWTGPCGFDNEAESKSDIVSKLLCRIS
jgi:hypothetical protein